ncbi:MAG: CrcB family protein [Planctomycetes bacterium]|nr:CrcB family protein [Planctomycetota bacterium]
MNGMTIALVAAGGALGAVMRVVIQHLLGPLSEARGFAIGTLAANLLGCLAIGIVFGLLERIAAESLRENLNAFVVAGVLGALTTYSTFALDLLKQADAKGIAMAALYLGLSLVLGLALAALGLRLSGASLSGV